jgi:general transcription factor 3C polypeptide 5 (transcription factor C subunit 1)
MPRRPLPDRPRRTTRTRVEDETEPEPEPEPAPEFELGTREVFAVEHPAIIQNLDNGIKTFGRNHPFERVSPSPC